MKGFILALALAVAATPAAAQIGKAEGPILIDSDRSELRNDEGRAIFEGNVEATQGQARLLSNRLEVEFEKAGQTGGPGSMGAMETVIATGDVFYITPEETARGQRAVYDITTETLVMTGDVVVKQGCDVSTGDKLTVDLVTGNSTMDGKQSTGGNDRVRVVLYPDGEAEQRDNCE